MEPRVEFHPLKNAWVVVTREANGKEHQESFPNVRPDTRTVEVQDYLDRLPKAQQGTAA